jgi:hypothetical protein
MRPFGSVLLLHRYQIFTDCFGRYCLSSTKLSKLGFEEFLHHEQNDEIPSNSPLRSDRFLEYFETSPELYMTIEKVSRD